MGRPSAMLRIWPTQSGLSVEAVASLEKRAASSWARSALRTTLIVEI